MDPDAELTAAEVLQDRRREGVGAHPARVRRGAVCGTDRGSDRSQARRCAIRADRRAGGTAVRRGPAPGALLAI